MLFESTDTEALEQLYPQQQTQRVQFHRRKLLLGC